MHVIERRNAMKGARYLSVLFALMLLLAACGDGVEDDADEAAPADDAPADQDATADEPTDGDDQADEAADPAGDELVADEEYLVGVSLASPTLPLYVAMEEGIRDRAEELGVEVIFTDADQDVVAQLDDIQDLIVQDVDGLLISPVDAEAAVPAYESAEAAGIPAMSIARSVEEQYQVSFVGEAWQTYGAMIAEWTCGELGGEGTVALIKGPAGASFVEEMEEGYKDFVESDCPELDIVFEVNMAPLGQQQGLDGGQDALTAHPDVDAIFANNDDLALGVLQALEERDLVGQVLVTGFNGDRAALEQIQADRLSMTIALRPYHWGILGLESMVRYLNGEDLPDLVPIETEVVDQSNIDDLEWDDLR